MKISLINFTYNKKSGIENVADNTIRQIDEIDKDNEYILLVNDSARNYYIDSLRIKKIVIKMAGKQVLKTVWLLFIYPVYALVKGIDVTLIFNCSSNFALSPFTKNIIYIHDIGELLVENKYDITRMIYRKFIALPINKLFGNIFVVVSKSTQNDVIKKLKIARQKVKLIYNGADQYLDKLDKDYARKHILQKYKIKDHDKIIITIGRIDPVGKNLIKLVEAVDILRQADKDFHLFLIGESNFPNSHHVPEAIRKLQLDSFVTLTGYVDSEELSSFYNAADLLVFPSIHEGFGLPLLEAMKCELPVACSDIEVFHEVANNAAVYFDPNDVNDIADKISTLLQDAALRSSLIEKGRIRQSRFTWRHSAEQLLELINSDKSGQR